MKERSIEQIVRLSAELGTDEHAQFLQYLYDKDFDKCDALGLTPAVVGRMGGAWCRNNRVLEENLATYCKERAHSFLPRASELEFLHWFYVDKTEQYSASELMEMRVEFIQEMSALPPVGYYQCPHCDEDFATDHQCVPG